MQVATLFRPQRGSLADAMAEVVELPQCDAMSMAAYFFLMIRDMYGRGADSPAHVRVHPYYGVDPRIGWDTYIVTAWSADLEYLGVYGFTNGPMPWFDQPNPAPYI